MFKGHRIQNVHGVRSFKCVSCRGYQRHDGVVVGAPNHRCLGFFGVLRTQRLRSLILWMRMDEKALKLLVFDWFIDK